MSASLSQVRSVLPPLALAVALAVPSSAGASAYIVLQVEDPPGQGFADPAPVAPAGGNPATTLGEARLKALEFAAGLWAEELDSPVPIEIEVRFEALGGDPTFATLGIGGPVDVYRDFSGAPQPATWFPGALANRLGAVDLDGGTAAEIEVVFNLDVDGPEALGPGSFYYGFDGHPPAGDASFVQTALHEIAHGLGFTSQLNLATGEKLLGQDDVYMSWVERIGASPADLPSMTDAERLDALRSGSELRWVGPELSSASGGLLAGADGQGRVDLHAPPQITTSTLRHFASGLDPNDVMEPFYSEGAWDLTLARALLGDLGWGAPTGCFLAGEPDQGVVWFDDQLPSGATPAGTNEGWLWIEEAPGPYSGSLSHYSGPYSGNHQHYFHSSAHELAVGAGDALYSWVYLDPQQSPTTVMLQFNDRSSWNHRAYWGSNDIPWGADGTEQRRPMGALPPAGEWVRLEVPASEVGLVNKSINGMAFALNDGAAAWDLAGLLPASEEVVWCDEALPPGATPQGSNESWAWASSGPTPVVGDLAHASADLAGMHQHYFTGATDGLPVNSGDTLYAWVYLDPTSPPRTLMLQWHARGSWNHRAYWGEDLLQWPPRVPMGPLPPAGQWMRLEVPATQVGLEGKVVTGMAYSLYDGKATFDASGLLRAGG